MKEQREGFAGSEWEASGEWWGLFLGLRSWFVLLLLFSKTRFTGEAHKFFFFFFFSAWERKTVSLLITLLTHSVWVFHTKQFPGHQRVCPTVQFSYDTNYPELAQIPQDKGSVPQDFPPPSASNHKFHVVICTSVDCYKLRVPLTSSGSIICNNGSWNLGKHYRGKARWRGTQREDWKGSGCRRFCPCGIGVHHPPST